MAVFIQANYKRHIAVKPSSKAPEALYNPKYYQICIYMLIKKNSFCSLVIYVLFALDMMNPCPSDVMHFSLLIVAMHFDIGK